jgi:N-acetylmuramoyl-L-alanine amidase
MFKRWVWVLALAGLCAWGPLAAWGAEPDAPEAKTVVVLDPGHGGEDAGLSSAGLAEKEFALKVAQEVKTFLGKDGALVVWLTRAKDQSLSLNARQSFANAKNAQVFVSLHASENLPGEADVFVFTHHVEQGGDLKALAERTRESDISAVPWDQAQAPVKSQSRTLAKALGQAWEEDKAAGARAVHVQEVPLGVLTGVKAPAVLVEMPLPAGGGAKAHELAWRSAAKVTAAGIRDYLERR